MGYDAFMNIVLGDTIEEISGNESKNIGTTVCFLNSYNIYFKKNFN